MTDKEKILFSEQNYICADGTRLHYTVTSPGKPPLVLLHGLCMCALDYEKVIPELAKVFTVYALDCPGHGQSDKKPEDYSCRKIGDALCEFIRQVTGECFLSGHSIGGILASYIAGREKESVKALLLEDPPFFELQPPELENTLIWKDVLSILHGFIRQEDEKDYLPYYLKHSYVYNMFGTDFADRMYTEAKEFIAARPGEPVKLKSLPANTMQGLKYMDSFDPAFAEMLYSGAWLEGIEQEKLLRDIDCPVIYMKAVTRFGKDGVLWAANTEEDASHTETLIKNCRRININCGHNIHCDRPAAFIEAAKEMLEYV